MDLDAVLSSLSVSAARLAAWARSRTPIEWLALGAAAAVFGYVGWDLALWDPRLQLLLHLIAVGVVAGLALHALRGGLVPRTPVDLPLLALLAAFAAATVTALNVGMSLRAMAGIGVFALMLPVALLAVRHRPTLVALVTTLPILVMSVPTLLTMAARRIDWVLAGAPGIPPIRMAAEGTFFGSVAVPPFVIWMAWVLAALIAPDLPRRIVRTGLVVTGVPLTILSGSRSAWLAVAVAAALALVPWAWRRRGSLPRMWPPNPKGVVLALVGLAAAAGAVVIAGPRMTAMGSVFTRVNLWRDTLNAWLSDPLLGIGPGFMPYARMAAADDFSFPVRQPHSHNLPLGLLGDAGIVGLAAGVVLVAALAWFAGPWRSRTPTGRWAGYALIGLGASGLFEDLTFLPNFNLLVTLLVAVALLDAGTVSWSRFAPGRRPLLLAAVVPVSIVLAAAMVVADAGALTYRRAMGLSLGGQWPAASDAFERSVDIDPWHPAGPKALTVAADAARDAELARRAAEMATRLNPGDGPSWTNLALLCAAARDAECQAHATDRAVQTTERIVPNTVDRTVDLVNAAFSYESLGRTEDADAAYRDSLLSQRLTGFASEWPRPIEIGNASLPELGRMLPFNRLLAWWAMEEPIDPAAIRHPSTRALAHAMRGERAESEDWLARAMERYPNDRETWDIATVLYEYWGVPSEEVRAIGGVVRGGGLPPDRGVTGRATLTYDIASFRSYPRDGYVRAARRLIVRPPYPWTLERMLPEQP